MTEPARRSRREVLGLAGAAAAAVVTGGAVGWRVSRTGDPTPIPPHAAQSYADTTTTALPDDGSEAITTTTETAPDPIRQYETVDGEVFAAAKLAGVRAVESLMQFNADDQRLDVVGRTRYLVTPQLDDAALAGVSQTLFVPGADSIGRVVYPQLGGLHTHRDPTSGSIMVVAEQHLQSDGLDLVVSRCIDVRVALADGAWFVEGFENDSGLPVGPPDSLSDEALRVLEHPDIDMPDSVRWDIYEDVVDQRILVEMADLADEVPIGVVSCRRGHPTNVFGTQGLSAHSVGRAVDIWYVGDRPVVQQREDESSIAYEVSQALFDVGRIDRLGAPWAFDPAGGWSWTDPVHKDHLHLGVSA